MSTSSELHITGLQWTVFASSHHLPPGESPLVQLKELQRGLGHQPRAVQHKLADMVVIRKHCRPPGPSDSFGMESSGVQAAERAANNLYQATGGRITCRARGLPEKATARWIQKNGMLSVEKCSCIASASHIFEQCVLPLETLLSGRSGRLALRGLELPLH